MAKKGQTIRNKVTGESITWIETSADSGGRHLSFQFEVAPNGFVPVRHIHPNQDEYFEIESGELKIELNGHTRVLKSGETIVIPKGQPHQWWNNSNSVPVKLHARFEPALKTEVFFEQFFGLGNDGKTKTDGTPSFMQIMSMSNEYDIFIAGPPIPVQRVMGFLIGGIARLIGFKKYYKQYSS